MQTDISALMGEDSQKDAKAKLDERLPDQVAAQCGRDLAENTEPEEITRDQEDECAREPTVLARFATRVCPTTGVVLLRFPFFERS